MVQSSVLKRTSLILLLAALLSFLSLGPVYAQSQSETNALKDKVAQLESQLGNLESVVKSLSLEIQQVSDASGSTVQQFGPRLYTVEQIVKDNGFQIQRLNGTVADLANTVKQLADLPDAVAHAQSDIASLNDQLSKTTTDLSNRIQASELGISNLKDAVDKAVSLTNAMQANVGSLLSRMDAAEGKISDIQNTVGSVAARVSTAEGHIADLQNTANQVTSLTATVTTLQADLAKLSAAADKNDARISRLEDIVQRLGQLDQLQGLAERVQANSQQLTVLQDQVQAIMKQLGTTTSGQPGQAPADLAQKIDSLTSKVSDVLIQATNNQKAVTDLQNSLASIKSDVAQQVQTALSGVPSAADIQKQIQDSTAAAVKQAEMKADAANGLAIVGLLAGLAAIVIALLHL